MARLLQRTIAVAALAAVSASADQLCSLKSATYAAALQAHPEASLAIQTVQDYGVSTWYTDRASSGDYAATAEELVDTCSEDTRLSIVVYGLPNKDCEAGASTVGSRNTNDAQYKTFIQTLVDTVGSRKALYVLEPDAVGLVAKEGGCGEQAGYIPNLKTAIELLSRNVNAEIYLDIGYWALEYSEPTARVVSVVQELQTAGRIKGIALNTANYQSTDKLASLCSTFQTAYGSDDMHCIVDTSRNYNNEAGSTEWCNLKSAGIGYPPTEDTGYSNLDYFVWLKPPGESDGQCDGRTSDAAAGPAPGDFFFEGFTSLWNQGYFVDKMDLPKIGEATTAPTTQAPAPTTSAPITVPTQTPEPVVSVEPMPSPVFPTPSPTTVAPIFQSPIQILPISDSSAGSGGSSSESASSDGDSDVGVLPISDSKGSVDSSNADDEDPDAGETTKPTPAPSQLRPTPAPSQLEPLPTPAASSLRSEEDETEAPAAFTETSAQADGFAKSLLSGVVVLFAVAVGVLGIMIMVNRGRQNRLNALDAKRDSYDIESPRNGSATAQAMMTVSPNALYRAL